MKKTLFIILTVISFAFINAGAQTTISPADIDIVKGKIRIKLKRENLQEVNSIVSVTKSGNVTTGIQQIDVLNEEIGIKRIERVFPFSIKFEAKHREYGLHLWYELDFDETLDPKAIAEQYSVLDEVDIAKPLYQKVLLEGEGDPIVVKIDTVKTKGAKINVSKLTSALKGTTEEVVFDDPMLPKQWHYENDGTIGTKGVDIDLFNAWAKTSGSKDVIVAVVDGGIDLEHEDLKDNLWVNEAELNGEEGVDDDGNGYIDDIHGYNFVFNGKITPHDHGTHVAGTVSAVNNNGIGVCGVAGGDGSGNGARLMSCQIYDNRGGTGNYAAAIIYGADMGAVISQNSWGYTQPGFYEPEVLDAIRYFINEAGHYEGSLMTGGVVFFAAGNTNSEERHYPGAFDEVVAVAATGPEGYRAPYATIGDWVDISAPGGDQAYYGVEGGVLSTLPDNNYGFLQGSSMATPHASGVAALIVARFGGDRFRGEDLEKIILNSTTPFSFDSNGKLGSGNLNAALSLVENEYIAPDPITDLRADEVFHNEIRLKWTVPKDSDDFQPSFFIIAISQSEITASNFNTQQRFIIQNYYEAGTEINLTVSGLIKETNYWFALKSSDRFNNVSDISNILGVKTTKPPHFTESLREVEFNIDVTQNPERKVDMTFSNTGEGIVYWNSYTVNEKSWWIPLEEWDDMRAAAIEEYNAKSQLKNTEIKSTVTELSAEQQDEVVPDYILRNDKTLYVDRYSYVYSNPDITIGSNTYQAGLIHATKFITTSEFNMTHVLLGLYSMHKDKPVYIEIKRGSDNVQEAKTIYVQKYYVDTTRVLNYPSIPLYESQYFDEGETFWVVLYFDKEEYYPLLGHRGRWMPNFFYVSTDNGNTFKTQYKLLQWAVRAFVIAGSTGEDGSYTYIDPYKGELAKGESQKIDLIVNASKLSNGHHIATVGINTTDIDKPGVSVEVKVTVTGQKADIGILDMYKYEINVHKDNKLAFEIRDTGKDSLFIYDVIDNTTGNSVRDFTDTIGVKVNEKIDIPIVYTTDSVGLLHPQFTLKTSIDDILLSTEMSSVIAPEIIASIDNDEVTIDAEQTTKVKLTIENSGDGSSLLEYDLDDYNVARQSNGFIPYAFDYSIRTSDDPVNPVVGEVTNLAPYASVVYDRLPYWLQRMKLKSTFPLYDVYVNEIYYINSGSLFVYALGPIDTDENASEKNRASGYIFPILINASIKTKHFEYFDFGDRQVYSVTMGLARALSTGVVYYNNIKYQIVTFRDGAIEFHYIDMDALQEIPDVDYAVGIQGTKFGSYKLYKDWGDDTKLVHNGMIIRFEPDKDPSFIHVDGERKGVIAKGTNKDIDVVVEPSVYGLGADTYTVGINVKSNAGTPSELIPLTVNVTGTPEISSSTDTVDFGDSHIGHDKIKYFEINNTGTKSIEITSITIDNSDFRIDMGLPYVVSYRSDQMIPVIFNPSVSGEVNTTAIVTFEDGHTETIRLLGKGLPDPDYTVNIESDIVRDITGGETVKVPFVINNSDRGVPLNYKFTNSVFAKVKAADILPAEGVKPDTAKLYGYSWKFSDSTKVFHKWKNIKKSGVSYDIQQDEPIGLKLPFKFPFYGALYDSVWVSRNGYIAVVEPEDDSFGVEFKPDDGMRGVIAPFIANLVPGETDSYVWIQEEEDRIFFLWDGYRGFSVESSGGNIYFQLEIVNDGSIYFHYLFIDDYTHVLNYGLESPDESETFEHPRSWILKWGKLTDTLTVAIAPPLRDEIENATSQTLQLELSAKEIYRPGVYKDTVVLKTNSLSKPGMAIPVTLNVTGVPVLDTPDTLKWEQEIYRDGLKIRKRFVISNVGHDIAEVGNIKGSGLYKFELYDDKGNLIRRTSTGTLFDPLEIEPWDELTVEVEVDVNEFADVDGKLFLSGNFETDTVNLVANIVESPVFAWDATDQYYSSLNNTDLPVYSFTIENNGETELKYNLVPVVVPNMDDGEVPDSIVDEIGQYQFEQPMTVDSVNVEFKENADGYETPLIEVSLAFANEFIIPEGGFYLTHIKVNGIFKELKKYISIQVWKGGDEPMKGKLIYRQEYVTYRYVQEEWIYFPLKYPVSLEAGEKYYLVIVPPRAFKYVGYDIAESQEVAATSWAANYRSWSDDRPWNWQQYNYMMRSYKIRGLTAAGDNLWIELDNLKGKLKGGESVEVTTSVFPKLAGEGKHKGMIKAFTDDVNHSNDEFKIEMDVNGAPEIKFRPNMYDDTIKVQETEVLAVNYIFDDPEGESVTFTLEDSEWDFVPEVKKTGPNSAQLIFKPGYLDSGVYNYVITLTDDGGSVVNDEVVIEVVDKNRPPELNPEYKLITLNMADANGGLLTIDPNELFTDADGDQLLILAGNYTPDIVDMALGLTYIDLHPLQVGTGFLVFGADDGKENGFVVYGVYVQVIDDESLVDASPDSFEEKSAEKLVGDGKQFALYPNPVSGSKVYTVYKLEDEAEVVIDIFNIDGTKEKTISKGSQSEGIYTNSINVGNLPAGLHFCKLIANGKVVEIVKFYVK